jgi:hypothetical protein
MEGYELLEDFYVRCPSNVDQPSFTSTKTGPAHFQFNLSHPIVLSNNDEWYVALHELFIPKHYYNIYNPMNYGIFKFSSIDLEARKKEVEELRSAIDQWSEDFSGDTLTRLEERLTGALESEPLLPNSEFNISIPSAKYTCEDFVEAVNTEFRNRGINTDLTYSQEEKELSSTEEDQTPLRRLDYDKRTAKFTLTILPGDIVILGNDAIRGLLGLYGEKTIKEYVIPPGKKALKLKNKVPDIMKHTHFNSHKPISITFPKTCDLDSFTRHLYIYADVMKWVRVGDAYAPLMRIVNLSTSNGDMINNGVIHKEFIHRQYFPVKDGMINSIEIIMRTSGGDIFPFKHSTSILDLHFARFKKKEK